MQALVAVYHTCGMHADSSKNEPHSDMHNQLGRSDTQRGRWTESDKDLDYCRFR